MHQCCVLENTDPLSTIQLQKETLSECHARETAKAFRDVVGFPAQQSMGRRLQDDDEKSLDDFWGRLKRDESVRARRIDNYFFERSCLMEEDFIRRFHEHGCRNEHFYLLSPEACGAVGATGGRHCPLENMTLFMSDMTSGWQIESQMGTLLAFLFSVMLMQVGGIPSPYGALGKFTWFTWMLTQASQLIVTLLSVMLICQAFLVSLDQLDECSVRTRMRHHRPCCFSRHAHAQSYASARSLPAPTPKPHCRYTVAVSLTDAPSPYSSSSLDWPQIFSAAGMPVLGLFFLTTVILQPVVLNKCMIVVMCASRLSTRTPCYLSVGPTCHVPPPCVWLQQVLASALHGRAGVGAPAQKGRCHRCRR